MRQLRPHQQQALSALRASLMARKRRPLLQAPTGAGKTRIAAEIIKGAYRKGNRVLFVVPALSLIDQSVSAFESEGILDVGVIQAAHERTDPTCRVQVASVQTLMKRTMPACDIAIVDECHKWFQWFETWFRDAQHPIIGLSATPWTKGLGKHYDDLIIAATTRELIDAGYLSKFRTFAPSHPDLTGVRTKAGDYHEGDLSKAMDQTALVADVVTTWLQRGENRPTLCFCVDRAHAKHVQQQFEAAGVPTGYIDAFTEREEREEIAGRFRRGEVKIVCNVGVLTTGIDWDVRCLILARPTKSEILFTQIIGRGLRTADGKQDCIARDSLVLTDKGLVKIQDVTLDHKVWDGVSFVSHKGAVCRGVQKVIHHDGVTGTPDHKVMTNVGWESLESAARYGRRIARTELGGQPVRLADDCLANDRGAFAQSAGGSRVRSVRGSAHGAVSQHEETARDESLPVLQWTGAGDGAALALSAMPSTAGSVLQSALNVLRSVWGARRGIPVLKCERGSALDFGQPRGDGSVNGDRSDSQFRALRAGEPSLGHASGEHEQQPQVGRGKPGSVYRVPHGAPGSEVCRSDLGSVHSRGADVRADRGEMEHPFGETEREVWDILDAGPLHRFTVSGRLVHNCLILDHSDTTLRLGFVDEIHHDQLDDGTMRATPKQQKESLPKECPSCAYLKPPKTPICPSCGFKPEPRSGVVCEDGELVELGAGRKPKPGEASIGEKERFYAELRGYVRERGYKPGFAAQKYRAKFGTWPPNGMNPTPLQPSPATLSWIKSQQIRYAAGYAKRRAA